MTSIQMIALAGVLAIIAAYPLVMRLAAEWAHPARLRMADLGRQLLSSPYLSESEKRLVDMMLDDAFNWRMAIYLSAICPAYIIARLFHLRDAPARIERAEARRTQAKFMKCYLTAIMAANPLFAPVLLLELLLLRLCARWKDDLFSAVATADRHLHHVKANG